jgi:hypothetical protein
VTILGDALGLCARCFLEGDFSWRVTGSPPTATLVARAAQTVVMRRESYPLSLGDADHVGPSVSALRCRCGGVCFTVDAWIGDVVCEARCGLRELVKVP